MPAEVFKFYGWTEDEVVIPQSRNKAAFVHNDSDSTEALARSQVTEKKSLDTNTPVADLSDQGVHLQDSSVSVADCEDMASPSDAPAMPPEPPTDVTTSADPLLQSPSQSASVDVTSEDDKDSNGSEPEPPACSGSCIGDPRLEMLISQVDQGRKNGTRLYSWLQSQSLLNFWPPTDTYHVDRQRLLKRVANLDDLTAILTAPVRCEYTWFVAEFVQSCRNQGYEVEDTSGSCGLEINMFLDALLRPAHQGKAVWSTESVKNQLRTIIEHWAGGWTQLRDLAHPSVPTLEFLVNCRALWEAARQISIEAEESKILSIMARFERHDETADLA